MNKFTSSEIDYEDLRERNFESPHDIITGVSINSALRVPMRGTISKNGNGAKHETGSEDEGEIGHGRFENFNPSTCQKKLMRGLPPRELYQRHTPSQGVWAADADWGRLTAMGFSQAESSSAWAVTNRSISF